MKLKAGLRNNRCIDRTFLSYGHSVAGTVPLLESDDSTKNSNHKLAFLLSSIPRVAPYEWLSYSYWYYNPDSAKAFGGWQASKSWEDLEEAEGSNGRQNIANRSSRGR